MNTFRHESDPPRLEEVYPLLCAYRSGKLREIWEQQKARNTQTAFNTLRAGIISAAQLAGQYGREMDALENEIGALNRVPYKFDEDAPIVTLYDWFFVEENDNLRREVVDLSGSRTIIEDIEEYGGTDIYPFK